MDLASQPSISGVKMKDDADTSNTNNINGMKVGEFLICGTIASDTKWDNPDITYYLQRNVTVQQGATLTIGAGQVVKFQDGQDIGIIVNGTLSAVGTEAKPIIFTEDEDDAARGQLNSHSASPA